ncbi:hypothetical protein MCOR23_002987 [Pyricularia oryzae]|nr:hypothetical protein MCOR19_002037 [Pyricularia oryzae]KAI6384824.1 hypothetical protein MCOR32_001894 [Pyricularia oryzae]KAI6402505.1 hypothetical protein MCOR20_007660 [Pyricularia oryzae]KAI6404696.1 hypothetical protein MCOR23_002987 [Pyricularia oryzae]KAI6477487.1 hypothetical protein MCOR18_006659 [Pyricularia oryzae]
MGNTQSQESSHGPDYERKAPAKLVKQRYDANADEMRFFSSSSTPGLILAGGHPARRYTMPAGQSPSVASFDHSVPLPTRQNSSTALNLLSAGREPLSDAGSRLDSTAEEKQRKDRNRRSIFRSKSSSAETTRRAKPERRNTIIATSTPPLPPIEGQGVALPPNRMSMFAGPSDSPYLDEAAPGNWHINDNRTSWHYDLKTYDAKRLLNLVQDNADASRQEEGSVGVSAAVSEQRFSVVSETTWKSSHPAQPAENASLPRVNSDLSMYTPVRRRSVIQTPGVATRHNSSRPPSVNHRFSHPPTPSNLSRQPSLEFEGRVKSMPPPPMPMPEVPPMPRLRDPDEPLGLVTPCEGDYQTIGAFKLGTLRITNGCASPVPSPEPDEKHMINPPAPSSPQLPNNSSYFTQKLSAAEAFGDPEADAVGGMDGIIPGSRSTQVAKMTARSSIDFIESTAELPETVAENQLFDSNALVLGSSPASPWLQTTSRTNAVEDNLFEDDVQPEYSMVEKLDLRLDPSAKRDLKSDNPTQARGISRSDSGFVSSPNSDYPAPQKALSKTDSGYSSNISLRSLRDGPSKKGNAEGDRSWTVALRRMSSAGSALEAPVPELKLDGSLEISNPETVAEPLRSPPPPTPPPKDFPVAALGRRSSLKPGQAVTSQQTGNAASKLDARDAKQDTISPSSSSRTWQVVPESPSSPHSATSEHSGSALSIGSSPVKPGRLQRFLSIGSSGRSKSLTTHATHVAEETDIPPVPKQMRRNLRTHSGLFPMTTKRLAVRPQRSRDTLKTIISVGSLEMHAGAKDALPYMPSANSASSSTVDHRHTFAPSSLGQVTFAESEAAVEADLVAPKPTRTPSIPRKPVASRGESVKRILSAQFYKKEPEATTDVPPAADPEPVAYAANNSNLSNNKYGTEARAITEEGRLQGLFPSPTGRAKSLTSQVERSWSIKNWASPSPTLSSFGPQDSSMPQSPASIPSPLIPEIMRKKKTSTPPPVSMRTRNQPTARASQPLRAMSTPPADAQSDMLASPSRRAISHELLRQSPSSYGRERPQQQFLGGLDPLQFPSNAAPTSQPQFMPPDWPIRSEHTSFNKRHTAIGQVNSTGLFIAELPADDITQRPSASGAGAYPRPKSAHRAGPDRRFSHDFASQNSVRPPPAHANQQRGILKQQSSPNFDPKWSRGPSQQFQQHWDQQEQQLGGRYHPYVPRGHGRNRSMTLAAPASGQPGQGVPYRILHSYNSPAYRNAPIWG